MKVKLLPALILLGSVSTLSASAQCLPLAQMAGIAADPKSSAKPDKVNQLPPAEWVFRGTPEKSREIIWESSASSASADGTSIPALFSLRPFQHSYDAVLKTTEASCIRDIRSELKALKMVAVPVTCPSCEAVRYDGPNFQTTIYSKMKGNFPYIVVVHPLQALPATITKEQGGTSAQ